MELTKKELSAYLPYDLIGQSPTGNLFKLDIFSNIKGSGIESRCIEIFINDEYKPILYPLDYLTKPIWCNGNEVVLMDIILDEWNDLLVGGDPYTAKDLSFNPQYWEYWMIELALEHRLDIFELIPNGLAIPVTDDFNPYK